MTIRRMKQSKAHTCKKVKYFAVGSTYVLTLLEEDAHLFVVLTVVPD